MCNPGLTRNDGVIHAYRRNDDAIHAYRRNDGEGLSRFAVITLPQQTYCPRFPSALLPLTLVVRVSLYPTTIVPTPFDVIVV